jgi:MFS family permease
MYAHEYDVQEADMASVSAILSDGSAYVKEGLVEKWQRWIILIVLMAIQGITMSIIPLFNGYLVRVYGSPAKQAPEIEDYKRLFIDGWKLNIVAILYMIPAIIVGLVLGVMSLAPVIAGIMNKGRIDEILGLFLGSIGLLVAGLVFAVITLIMYMAFVHFSRSGKVSDAFAVGAIVNRISSGIGWGMYIAMWIVIWILSMILFLIIMGFNMVPPLGMIAGLVLAPLWGVFIAKINCDIYDTRT